jgi:serine protease inhibitor
MAATAASQINGWVSNATGNMIKDIISPESITPGEKMMALNVVYFKGELLSFFGGRGERSWRQWKQHSGCHKCFVCHFQTY